MFCPAAGSSSWLALNSGVQGAVPVSLASRHRLTTTISPRPQHLCTTAVAAAVPAAFCCCCNPAAQACSCTSSANTSRRTRPRPRFNDDRLLMMMRIAACSRHGHGAAYGSRMGVRRRRQRNVTCARVIVSPCVAVVVRVCARAPELGARSPRVWFCCFVVFRWVSFFFFFFSLSAATARSSRAPPVTIGGAAGGGNGSRFPSGGGRPDDGSRRVLSVTTEV